MPAGNEAVYKNITLHATLEPHDAGNGSLATQAKGELIVKSEADGSGIEAFDALLPFELTIDESSALEVTGKVGPGPMETKNVKVSDLTLAGTMQAERGKPLTANGQLSASDMFISTVNLSEELSRAVRINQIGDMSPGTKISELSAQFHLDQGTISTHQLHVRELDGLGDASADNGSFKVDSSLTLNYAATITLTTDATARIKSGGPMLGLFATLFENNNRLSVPLSITGDLRQPQVRIDVSRIF